MDSIKDFLTSLITLYSLHFPQVRPSMNIDRQAIFTPLSPVSSQHLTFLTLFREKQFGLSVIQFSLPNISLGYGLAIGMLFLFYAYYHRLYLNQLTSIIPRFLTRLRQIIHIIDKPKFRIEKSIL